VLAGSVQVAYVHPGTAVQHCWSASMDMLRVYDITHEQRMSAHPPIQFKVGTDGLPAARNSIMAHFLDKTDAEYLFMIDTDMGFAPDAVDRLVQAASLLNDDAPVIGALCFGLKAVEDPSLYGGYATIPFPTLYQWGEVEHDDGTLEPGFAVTGTYSPDVVMRVAGTGAAALLVHRNAAERVRCEALDGKPEWFERIRYKSGTLVSEDLSFCYRLGLAEIGVFVHTGVKTVHQKTVWVGEDYYLADRALKLLTSMPAPAAVPVTDEQLEDPAAIARAVSDAAR
jgi:hypothetical protein